MAMKKNENTIKEGILKGVLNALGKEPSFEAGFDAHGVWTYFYTYQAKEIKNVGSVTKDFWAWQAVHYALDAYQQVQTWEDSRKKQVWLKDLASQLDIMFRWLKDQVKLGSYEHPHMAEFKAPVIREHMVGAPEVEAVCERAVRKGIYRARKMLCVFPTKGLMEKSHQMSDMEVLTIKNLKAFCRFMERAGRMSQEGTIDSTKSGDAPSIALIEEMEMVSLKSRRGAFGIRFDFKKKKLEVKCNDRKAEVKKDKKGNVYQYVFPDMLDGLRIGGIKAAIPQDIVDKILALKQEVDTKGFPAVGAFKGMFDMAAELYHSIRECQKQDLAFAETAARGNKAQLRSGEQCAKNANKVAYNALTNMVRATAGARGLKGIGLVKQAVRASLASMGKDATRPSSFAGVILAEEFFEYILSLAPEEYRYTYDELEKGCDVVDGEEVEFKDGLVAGRNIYTNEVKAIPDGKYTVRVDGKRKWIETSIQERIEARIAENYKPNQLVFQTRGVKDLEAAKEAIDGAEKVVLVTTPVMVNGERISDAVIADGKVVCKFKTAVSGNEYKNDMVLNSMYGRKTGRVTYCHPISYKTKSGKEEQGLVVVLDEVSLMLREDIVKACEEASVMDTYKEEVKTEACKNETEPRKSSRFADMAAQMEEEDEETAAPKEEVKAEPQKAFRSKKVSLEDLLKNKQETKKNSKFGFSAEDFE